MRPLVCECHEFPVAVEPDCHHRPLRALDAALAGRPARAMDEGAAADLLAVILGIYATAQDGVPRRVELAPG